MAQTSRGFKDAIYEQFARIGHAVGSPRRLELLDLLCQGPRTVEALSRQAGQSLANTSHHLQVLRAARLVDAEKQGLYVTYRLAGEEVCTFFQALRGLAESRLAEIERITRTFLEERGALEPVQRDLLLERVRGGEVTVLDVRPREEFEAGHIPGAISVPLEELERRLSELPQGREIVAYCRGPYCVLSIEAVALLKERGFTALRMEDGVPEWRALTWPIETGASNP
ncbi:MAG TPA: metalloregulator ArsR/SmtB family transcription factor [bacterium]|jgi:rhodanese-related sulfurtransferase